MLRSITDHSLDLIFVKDRESRTIFINPAGVRLSGLPREQIIGRNDAEIYPAYADQAALFMAADRRVMESRQPETTEEDARTALGEVHTFLTTKTPRLDADGNVIGIVGISRDVTERKRAEESLRDAAQKAEAASRAKDSFLAALSHELRTPLTPALMAVSALESDPALSAEAREHLAMMRRSIQIEARLIDDLLDLTRVSHGKLRMEPAVIDIHQLIGHAQATVLDDLEAKSIRMTVTLEAQERHVIADPARLQQVFWNLFKNAAKFTDPLGTIHVRSFNPAPGRVAVCVEDSGIGISPEALAGIFDAFDQGDLNGRHEFGGLGLGLSISKAIIDLHGGELRAASEGRGRGAAFVVELDTTGSPGGAAPGDYLVQSPAVSLRLLIVEDHQPTLAVISRLLERDGHSVYSASTVADALMQAGQNECDLVISDVGLPDGTGFDLMREIRRRHGWPGIAITGYGMEADLRMAADSGFVTHLVKPVDFSRLREAIETTIAAAAESSKMQLVRTPLNLPAPQVA